MAVNGDTLRTASVEPTMEEREVHSPLYWLYLWNENFKEHEGCDRSRHVQQTSKSQRVFKEVERDLVSRNVHSRKKIQRKEPRVEDDGKVEERIASYRIGEEKRKEHGGQVLAERYVLYTLACLMPLMGNNTTMIRAITLPFVRTGHGSEGSLETNKKAQETSLRLQHTAVLGRDQVPSTRRFKNCTETLRTSLKKLDFYRTVRANFERSLTPFYAYQSAAATRARARGRTHRNAGEPAAGPEAGPTNDQPVHSEEDA
uniref:Uncharacterized protein n=1 Tax=Vespula pensylvanica TaxID=30213 RepID=A0A834U561_VESPE|nr:hypothetical protein H0235_011414 [Vespula pensylvanica]